MKINLSKTQLLISSISLFVISGCASTVTDVKSTAPMMYKSNQNSRLAANCVVKNIDDNYGKFMPFLQEGESQDNYMIRVRSGEAGNAALIEIKPIENGSLITTQISNHYPLKKMLTSIFTKGC